MQISSHRVAVRVVALVAVIAAAGELAAQQKTPVPDAAQLEASQRAAGIQVTLRTR